jgi:SAM-dependent methyltransferase
LDVGSLDINGSNRDHFAAPAEYIGLDLGPGPGVDLVCPVKEYKPGPVFDVVISTEALEHDKDWRESLAAMVAALKPGGLLILTCATTGRHEHGTRRTSPGASPYTPLYYGNRTAKDLAPLLQPHMTVCEFSVNSKAHDLYFWGFKKE